MIGRIFNASTALYWAVLLIFVLSFFCLSACTAPADAPEQTQQAAPAVETQPVEPEPETLPEMTDGGAVTVNGKVLADGCWLIDGVRYVRLWDLTRALGVTPEETGFTWQERTVCLESGSDSFLYDGEVFSLDAPVLTVLDELYVPLESLCLSLGMGCVEDEGRLYVTPGTAAFTLKSGYCVPTLMYHAVSDTIWGEADLFVSPAELEKQLQYLLDNGYTPIHFSDLAYVDEIEKPVLLTFDDGYADNYHELFPLLQQYGVKATVFVITNSLDNHDKYMTWAQAKEMADSGLVSIQSHTCSHPNLNTLPYDAQVTELEESYLAILRNTGYAPYVLCYPNGCYNQDTLDAAAGYYHFGLKMVGDAWYTDSDTMEIDRWFVSRYTDLDSFAKMLLG